MVYSTIPLESTSRSSLDVPIHQVSSATQSILLPQQQQHHLFYPKFSTISSTYSPSNPTNFQSQQCNSLDPRRHPNTNVAPSTLRNHEFRGLQKNSKWQTKSRPPRAKEHVAMQSIQQQHHHQLPQYAPAPLVLYDSTQGHLAAAAAAQVYLAQPSYNQAAAPYLPEPYTQFNPSMTPYYKPPDLSAFCLIPDRQNLPAQYSQQQQQQQQQQHSYYNVKSRFHLSASTNYPTSNLGTTESMSLTEKFIPSSSIINDNRQNLNHQFFDDSTKIDSKKFKDIKYIKSPVVVVDDKLIDESSNFNFTIEAEKMVSELCNTSSYEYDKDEDEKIEATSSLKISSQEVKAETNEATSADGIQSIDLIRKSIYWACNAAENILKNSQSTNNRKNTLLNLSTATKIALGKSSTCLPIYSGDEIFSEDLINAMLRISNGWLILDHYFNKQHPGIDKKCDRELINSFKNYETIMPNLIDNLVKEFVKVGNSIGSEKSADNSVSSSVLVPGDVSLYMNSGIFGNLPTGVQQQQQQPQQVMNNLPSSTRNTLYPSVIQNHEQKYHWLSSSSSAAAAAAVGRESKLKSKWTITENTKTSSDFPIQNLLSNETVPARSYNLILPSPLTSSICNTEKPTVNLTNRMTLLSQIETTKRTTADESETINLSAWFASMKNKQANLQQPWWSSSTSTKSRDTALKSSVELGLKMDVNRQLRTLKNMRTIQSAPWTANYILDDRNINNSKGPDDFSNDSDALRGYMKPGSYNVPKKKYQGNRASRNLCPPAAAADQPAVNYFDADADAGGNKGVEKSDVAWKAACASAEIFLGSMSVKKSSSDANSSNPDENEGEKMNENKVSEEEEEESYFTPQWKCKDFDKSDIGASSYEGSDGEESGIGGLSVVVDEGNKKSHVKTDSWLIKTLNNASHGIKNNNPDKEKNDDDDDDDKSICIETSQTISVMTIDVVGKATYSETVRRLPSKSKIISPIPHAVEKARDQSYHSISSFCSLDDSKDMKNHDSPVASSSIKSEKANEKGNKSKKGKNHQPGEKGWSVWYSSRRKQNNSSTLGPIVIEKLTSIHRTLWKMDSSRLFKYPSSNSKSSQNTCPRVTIEHYRKVIKNPMFLDTIGYKLKNHVYRKVEHVIKDFRKIVYNSKIYHKNDKDSLEKIEALSRKLEQLLNQYFSDKNGTTITTTTTTSDSAAGRANEKSQTSKTSTPTILTINTTTAAVNSEEKNSSSFSCRRVSRPS